MPIKQSNRLTVVLHDDMSVSYVKEIDTVYLNSYLYNEFVVHPRSKLRPTQTIWVTFANAENISEATNKTKPILLASRICESAQEVVVDNDEKIVQTRIDDEEIVEYYMQLPKLVLRNAGEWYFSVEIREVPDINNPKQYSSIADSGVYSFIVNNSLAGAGNDIPTDLDIVALYLSAKKFTEQATKYAPYIGANGHWFEFDKETEGFIDTGIDAEGPEGPEGPSGADGLSALMLTGTLTEENAGDFANEPISIDVSKFNRTPLVDERFFAYVHCVENDNNYVVYFDVINVVNNEVSCAMDSTTRIDIDGKDGVDGGVDWIETSATGNLPVATNGSTAIGYGTNANGYGATAISRNSYAGSPGAVALGVNAMANNSNSIAIGNGARTNSEKSIAIGFSAYVSSNKSIAIGDCSSASGNNSVAIGDCSSASGYNSVAIGHRASTSNIASIAIGDNARAMSYNSIAIGKDAVIYEYTNGAIVIGLSLSASIPHSIAIGTSSYATGDYGIAIGTGYDTGTNGIKIGCGTEQNVHIGAYNLANFSNGGSSGGNVDWITTSFQGNTPTAINGGTAIGYDAESNGDKSIAIGYDSYTYGCNCTAIGVESRANDQGQAFGYNVEADNYGSTALGTCSIASGTYATALGHCASADGYSSVAIGNEVEASQENAVAIGVASYANGENSIAIGYETKSGGDGSVAIGMYAEADGEITMAMGPVSYVNGYYSAAIGICACAFGNYSTAIGHGASADSDNSIYLGDSELVAIYSAVTSITSLSDERTKEDIQLANTAQCLADIERLPVHRFKYKKFARRNPKDVHITEFIAQEVAEVFPKSVHTYDEEFPVLDENDEFVMIPATDEEGNIIYDLLGKDEDGNPIYSTEPRMVKQKFTIPQVMHMDRNFAIPTMWAAIQELSKQIKQLKAQLEESK